MIPTMRVWSDPKPLYAALYVVRECAVSLSDPNRPDSTDLKWKLLLRGWR